MKKFFDEFKAFAMRGNVMDMAVGVVIGGAFSAIITSLVNDLLMPLLGVLTGGVDFSHLAIQLGEDSAFAYGNFIQSIINFIIIAFCIFCMVKAMNKMTAKKEEEPAPEEPKGPTAEELLAEIRDLMKESK